MDDLFYQNVRLLWILSSLMMNGGHGLVGETLDFSLTWYAVTLIWSRYRGIDIQVVVWNYQYLSVDVCLCLLYYLVNRYIFHIIVLFTPILFAINGGRDKPQWL